MLEQPPVTTDTTALRARIADRVRSLRQETGRSLADLAAAAGIGKSTLHAIEAGEANPGIETLWALAGALGVPFGALLEVPAPRVRLVRATEGPEVVAEHTAMRARLKVATAHHRRTELYTLDLEPVGRRLAEPHGRGTVEHVLLLAGALRVGPEDAEVTLEPGDLASFPGDVAHRYETLAPATRAVLLLEYP